MGKTHGGHGMKARLAKICTILPFALILAFFAALIVLPYILEKAKSVVK